MAVISDYLKCNLLNISSFDLAMSKNNSSRQPKPVKQSSLKISGSTSKINEYLKSITDRAKAQGFQSNRSVAVSQNKNQSNFNSKHNPKQTLSRCSSNSSFIQDLDLADDIDEHEDNNQQYQMIKISDGLYVGSESCIWDSYTVQANYITHLVTIAGKPENDCQQKQNHVPSTIQFIHSIQLDHISIQNIGFVQILSKLSQFVGHAHQLGQSCVIVCKQKEPLSQRNQQKNIHKSAAVTCAYLMKMYRWSALKSMQFVISRFNAAFLAAQSLRKINRKTAHKSHQNSKAQYQKNLMMTHMIPQLPRFIGQNMQQFPKELFAYFPTLQLLQKRLVQEGHRLSYGWDKAQLLMIDKNINEPQRDEQIILMNTFLNSIMGSQLNSNYVSLLSQHSALPYSKKDLKPKVVVGQKHKRSMKILSINKSTEMKDGIIKIKHTKSVDKAINEELRSEQSKPDNDFEVDNGCLKLNKRKTINSKKRVCWKQILVEQPSIQKAKSQTNSSLRLAHQSLIQSKPQQDSQKRNDQTNSNQQEDISLANRSSFLKAANIKNKIKINVINIVNNRRRQQKAQEAKNPALTRRKSICRLPTLLDYKQLQNEKDEKVNRSLELAQSSKPDQQAHYLTRKQKTKTNISDEQINYVQLDAILSEGNQKTIRRSNSLADLNQKQNKNSLNSVYNVSNTLKNVGKDSSSDKQRLLSATIQELKQISLKQKNQRNFSKQLRQQ